MAKRRRGRKSFNVMPWVVGATVVCGLAICGIVTVKLFSAPAAAKTLDAGAASTQASEPSSPGEAPARPKRKSPEQLDVPPDASTLKVPASVWDDYFANGAAGVHADTDAGGRHVNRLSIIDWADGACVVELGIGEKAAPPGNFKRWRVWKVVRVLPPDDGDLQRKARITPFGTLNTLENGKNQFSRKAGSRGFTVNGKKVVADMQIECHDPHGKLLFRAWICTKLPLGGVVATESPDGKIRPELLDWGEGG
ncbi:MAG TPA: hypothetical protein VNC50_07050 [Planctomycetia bacterium]|nr:hypothetical protein [Planctomycetia bacterium]